MSQYCGQCGEMAVGAFCGRCGAVTAVAPSSVDSGAQGPLPTIPAEGSRKADQDAAERTSPRADDVVPSRRPWNASRTLMVGAMVLAALSAGGALLVNGERLPWRDPAPATASARSDSQMAGGTEGAIPTSTPPTSIPESHDSGQPPADLSAPPSVDAATVSQPFESTSLTLLPHGLLLLEGEDVSQIPYELALPRLASELGPPDETTAVGEACGTHVSPGFAVRWKNFRVLIQTEDHPYQGGNSRKGSIAGWELHGWGEDRLEPSPTMSGLGLGSTLEEARSVYPNVDEGEGDGTWAVWIGPEIDDFSGASLHFDSNSPNATLTFMDSGYACGS